MERDYLQEAYRIVKSQTLLLPERKHLEVLVKENIALKEKIGKALESCEEKV